MYRVQQRQVQSQKASYVKYVNLLTAIRDTRKVRPLEQMLHEFAGRNADPRRHLVKLLK